MSTNALAEDSFFTRWLRKLCNVQYVSHEGTIPNPPEIFLGGGNLSEEDVANKSDFVEIYPEVSDLAEQVVPDRMYFADTRLKNARSGISATYKLWLDDGDKLLFSVSSIVESSERIQIRVYPKTHYVNKELIKRCDVKGYLPGSILSKGDFYFERFCSEYSEIASRFEYWIPLIRQGVALYDQKVNKLNLDPRQDF